MRAFIALELPEAVRAACAEQLAAWRAAAGRLRLTAAESLHITLAFLGDVPEERSSAIADAVRPVVAATERFVLAVRGCGAFPDARRPRVLWFGVNDSLGRCTALQSAVWGALEPLGFAPERRAFHPHITIARVRDGRLSPRMRAAFEQGADWAGAAAEAHRVVLMRSELGSGGSRYQELAAFPLG